MSNLYFKPIGVKQFSKHLRLSALMLIGIREKKLKNKIRLKNKNKIYFLKNT